jgi:hypothetical protein
VGLGITLAFIVGVCIYVCVSDLDLENVVGIGWIRIDEWCNSLLLDTTSLLSSMFCITIKLREDERG